MQNILRWKKSDRGLSHVRHGLDPRLPPPLPAKTDTYIPDFARGEFVTLFRFFHKFAIFKSWHAFDSPDSAENSLLL